MQQAIPALMALVGLASISSAVLTVQEGKDQKPVTETTQAVDPDEARTVWEYLARRYDADGDGKITAEEYTRGDEAFARLDRDKNGVIEQADTSGGRRGRGRRGPRSRRQGQRAEPPQEGELAPDFKLELLGTAESDAKGDPKKGDTPQKTPKPGSKKAEKDKGPELIQLSKFKGKKPVALIFGSYT